MRKISTSDSIAFKAAGSVLTEFVRREKAPRTQNFSVAIAVLLARARSGSALLPTLLYTPGQGPGITTRQLQVDVCDFVFEKASGFHIDPDRVIYKPFSNAFYPRSPAQNNWRNSFDLQAGISCDAPYDERFLKNPVYLSEPRSICPFRDSTNGHCSSTAGLAGIRTCFNPDKRNDGQVPGPDSSARPAAKLLTRGQQGDEAAYWMVEPTTEVLIDLLGHPAVRVPLYPFMAGLYCGSTAMMELRPVVDRQIMQSDLGLTETQFLSIFDVADESSWNREYFNQVQEEYRLAAQAASFVENTVANELNDLSGQSVVSQQEDDDSDVREVPAPDLRSIQPYSAGSLAQYQTRAGESNDPEQRLRLLEKAAHGHARALDILAAIASSAGFAPKEQSAGFDLLIQARNGDHLFEIKTWRSENISSQIRSGIAQLYEYRWRNRSTLSTNCSLYLVFDRSPVAEFEAVPWMREYLITDREIIPCWITGDRLETFPELLPHLAWLVPLHT